MTSKDKQALFLKTKNIGDSIILTSSISALPKDFRYVDIICFPESKAIFQMNERVRHIFVIPRHQKGIKKIAAYITIFHKLFKSHYDLLAHFSIDWRGALLARFLNVDMSVSRKTPRRGSFWHNSFDFLAPVLEDERPMVEQDIDLLRSANIYNKSVAPAYKLNVGDICKNKLKNWLKEHAIHSKNKLVVIQPSSRWSFKEIPIQTWASVIQALKLKKIHVILSGSKDDLKKNQSIADLCQLKPILTKDFSLMDTAALYKEADLVLTIDSMSTHLASAMQTPVISIFGPTNEKIWGPWKVKSRVLSMSTKDNEIFACRPCGQDGCDGSKVSQCLVQLSSKFIIEETNGFLWPQSSNPIS